MLSPCLIQKWCVSDAGALPDTPDALQIVAQDDPYVTDAVSLAPFDRVTESLTRWSQRVPGVFGIVARSPAPWRSLIALPWSPATPAYVLLQALCDSGWQSGSRKTPHKLKALTDGNKILHVSGCTSRKSYLLCLMNIDEMKDSGCDVLPISHYEGYYRCVREVDARISPSAKRCLLQEGAEGRIRSETVSALRRRTVRLVRVSGDHVTAHSLLSHLHSISFIRPFSDGPNCRRCLCCVP